MAEKAAEGPTRVAVAIIRCERKMLLVYNQKWRAFTFPMTKLRAWEYLDPSQVADTEQRAITAEQLKNHWLDTAAHAVVECLGQPNSPQPLLEDLVEVEYAEVERSSRDGAKRIYHYKIYTQEVAQEVASWQRPFAWLTAEQIRDGKHRPLSPTVLDILGRQEIAAIVRGWL